MGNAAEDPGARLRRMWVRLAPLPAGPWLFSRLLGWMIPYSGTIGARVVTLGPGHAVVRLADRRRVRNHLGSIHAVAMANLVEMATGLALNVGLPPGGRGILIRLEIEYVKKARGTLTADSRCESPTDTTERDLVVPGEIRDAGGDVVARAVAHWRVGGARR